MKHCKHLEPGGQGLMKRVHSLLDSLLAEQLRQTLELEGVACVVRNASLRMAMGDVPLSECWIELWVDEADFDRAAALVARPDELDDVSGDPWSCTDCEEQLEAQYDTCWSCGASRDEA